MLAFAVQDKTRGIRRLGMQNARPHMLNNIVTTMQNVALRETRGVVWDEDELM
jgi:hypothetical protein